MEFEDKSAAAQEIQKRREGEVGELKKRLDEETKNHEVIVTDMRHKHNSTLEELNEQLDNVKKVMWECRGTVMWCQTYTCP